MAGLTLLLTACTLPYWACDAQLLTGADARLVYAICTVESGGSPSRIHRNDGGTHSYGLCQIKLATARSLGYAGTREGLLDAGTNSMLAGRLLMHYADKGYSLVQSISAYNAGRPIMRNQAYIGKVLEVYAESLEGT